MLKFWCRIFGGSHLIGGYSSVLDYRPLKLRCFLQPGIEAVV